MANTYKIPTNINNRPPQPVDLGWVGLVKFDADDAAPDYIGLNLDKSASDDAVDWKVYKFTYNGDNVTTVELAYGTWTGRAGLF